MIKRNKSAIVIIVLAFTSIILTIGPPFQIANNVIENNVPLSTQTMGQVYAEDDDEYYDEENDGYYGGPKDSEGNLLDREDWPADAEYDNEDDTGPLKVDEKGFREFLKDKKDIDLDEDYSSLSEGEQKELEKEYKDGN